jgi:hypothetical protein
MLGEAHARVRGHFKGTHLDQAHSPAAGIGRIELVDAELGAMGVAAGIDEQIAKEAVNEPGWWKRRRGDGETGRRGNRLA